MSAKLLRPPVILPTAGIVGTAGPAFLGAWWGVLSWNLFFFILIAVAVIAGVALLTWWILQRQQAKAFSGELVKRQERNLASASPDKKANLAPLTDDFLKNIEVLRKLKQKKGIPAIYYLPWYMVFGAPASGKSLLLKGSNFRFCVNDTPIKEGGTLHCDWWFTNQAIFLDTAGRLTVHEGGAADKTEWEQLLKLLRRFRRKRPIDGMIVTVAADFLLEASEREIRAYAQQVRERIDRATEYLRIRCPVFVIVTKCDLVEGFKNFFDALPDNALTQILGWTNQTLLYQGPEQVEEAFDAIADRWRELRPALLDDEPSREKRRAMFPFPEEFGNLRDPFLTFLQATFQEDVFSRPPALAGFYFTSGTQEGTTVSRYFRRVGEQLGLAPEVLGRTFDLDPEERHPYFVKDMFWNIIAPSVGLTVPVDTGKDARRRVIVGVTSVTVAALFFFLSLISFARNSSYLEAYPERLIASLEQTTELGRGPLKEALRENLQHFGEAAAIVDELDQHPLLSGWGLNKRGRLRADARALFRDHFERDLWSKLMPAFRSGLENERVALSCQRRVDLLLSYLGLIGKKPGDLPTRKAVKRLLDLEFESTEVEQDGFASAWAIYREQLNTQEPEIDLSSAIRGVADVCEEESNPVVAVRRIQDDCSSPVGPKCFPRLQKVAGLSGESLDSRRRDLDDLTRALKGREVDADELKRLTKLLKEMQGGGSRGGGGGLITELTAGTVQDGAGCVESYFAMLAPKLKELVDYANNAHAKLEEHLKTGNVPLAHVVEADAKQKFATLEAAFGPVADQVNKSCEDAGLSASGLVTIARAYALGSAQFVPGYTKMDWTYLCDRLSSTNTELATKDLPAAVRQQSLANVETEARDYSSKFEQYWRDRLRKMKGSARRGGNGLRDAPAKIKEELGKVHAEVDGLKCPLVPSLENGPAEIASSLGSIEGSMGEIGAAAPRAAAAIQAALKAGKKDELLDQTLRNEGPIADFCKLIETIPDPDLRETLRAEIEVTWNTEVLRGLAANQKTAFQQQTMGVAQLTTRYPFKSAGESHAALDVVQPWLDPKNGKLTQLANQMGVLSAGAGGELPCDLTVKARAGPQTARFLRGAKNASDLIYESAKDGKPTQGITLTFNDIKFSDKGAEERYGVNITEVYLVLAGERLTYDMGQKRPTPLSVPLPSAAPVSSYIAADLVPVRRKPDLRPARLERGGEWSALALLQQAKRAPIPGSDGVRLTWEVPYGPGPPFILVTFDADARTKKLLETDFELTPTDDPER